MVRVPTHTCTRVWHALLGFNVGSVLIHHSMPRLAATEVKQRIRRWDHGSEITSFPNYGSTAPYVGGRGTCTPPISCIFRSAEPITPCARHVLPTLPPLFTHTHTYTHTHTHVHTHTTARLYHSFSYSSTYPRPVLSQSLHSSREQR